MSKTLIVIEGLDGSGKATQAKLLTNYLKDGLGVAVRQISFPDYESNSSALIKMYLAGEFGTKPDDVNAFAASSFFAVDRYASFKKDWEKDWKSGIIIADRYTTSNAVHQCSKLNESEWDGYLDWLFRFEYELLGIPEPTAVIYLRVEPEVSRGLLTERYHGDMSKEDIHEKDREYLNRCQKAAAYCSQKLGWLEINCTEDGAMRPIHAIQDDIQNGIRSLFQNDSGSFVKITSDD